MAAVSVTGGVSCYRVRADNILDHLVGCIAAATGHAKTLDFLEGDVGASMNVVHLSVPVTTRPMFLNSAPRCAITPFMLRKHLDPSQLRRHLVLVAALVAAFWPGATETQRAWAMLLAARMALHPDKAAGPRRGPDAARSQALVGPKMPPQLR